MKNNQLLSILNDVDEKYIEEASPMYKEVKGEKSIWIKWGTIVACLSIFVLSAVILPNMLSNNLIAPIEQTTPTTDSPNGMRKFMNYNNHRYSFLENGATYNLSSEQLISTLGTLKYDILENPQANSKKDLATSFAIGGTVYQLSTYNPLFRLAVELNGNHYICERVDTVDDTDIDVSEYFVIASFPENIEQIVINDHTGENALKTISNNHIELFIETLSTVTPANLTGDDYEKIGMAQKSGESYLVSFELNDSTTYKIYLLPTLSLAMIGDNKYTLSDKFMSEFSNSFEGLVQKPVPMQ